MAKENKSEAVIQDWVCELPFMQQALLMTALRGPDGQPKHCTAKCIIKYMRGVVLKPAGFITSNEDSFMWIDYNGFLQYTNYFFADTDAYPMHFLMHLIHAAEVVGYKHPDKIIRSFWNQFYSTACISLHMMPEEERDMNLRMRY